MVRMRIAVLGAGGPAGVNTLRALHVAGHELVALDDNEAHLVWCEEFAETFQMGTIVEADLWMACPDVLVLRLAGDVGPKFLPPKLTIQRCQDKHFAVREWSQAGLRSGPQSIIVPWPDHLHL